MNRREFNKLLGMGVLATQAFPGVVMAGSKGGGPGEFPRVPLGVCDHALRTMRPTADDLVDYAIEHRLDAVQLNTLRALEDRGDDNYLARLRSREQQAMLPWTLGSGIILP